MEIPYDEAIALLRTWEKSSPLPSLIVNFGVAGLAHVHALCEGLTVSDDNVTLFFGRVAVGNGQVMLPLRNVRFSLLKPIDSPLAMRSRNAENVTCWLEISTGRDDGCVITEYKSGGFVTVAGVGPLDITYKPQEKEFTP